MNSGSFNFSSSYNYTNLHPKSNVKRLNTFSKVFLGISMFFWVWAAHNTKYKMKSNFDLGMVSFLLSGLSSLYLFIKTRKGVDGFTSTGVCGRAFVIITHLIVSMNYALGAYMSFIVGKKVYMNFAIYCTVFTCLWSLSAYIGWILITNTIDIGLEEEDEDGEADDIDEEVDYMYNLNDLSNNYGDENISRRSIF
jgi:hypothetical protein